jgi:hypothetical protein
MKKLLIIAAVAMPVLVTSAQALAGYRCSGCGGG